MRADSGVARDALMTWCEAHQVDYFFGLAKNTRLLAAIARRPAPSTSSCTAPGARWTNSAGSNLSASPAGGGEQNPIKDCQPDQFADRTSMATMNANPLRLWFASFAYVLLESLRCLALGGTALAQATCGNVRLKRLKLGALVKISMRRIKITFASGCPCQAERALAYARLNPTPS